MTPGLHTLGWHDTWHDIHDVSANHFVYGARHPTHFDYMVA